MKNIWILSFVGLLMTSLLFSGDEEIQTSGWYVKFTVPYNDSTVYSLGQSTKSLTVQWAVNTNGSTLYKIRYYMDGYQYHFGQGTSWSHSFSIGSHTLLVRLFVYNILGQEILVDEDQIILTVNNGNYIYTGINFDGGRILIDNVEYVMYSQYWYTKWVTPGIHAFYGSQNQTGYDGKGYQWDHWSDYFGSPRSSNQEYSHSISTDGLGFEANYLQQPSTPTNFSVNTQSGIQLNWTAIADPVQYYEVWRKINSGIFTLLSTTTGTSLVDPDYALGGHTNLNYKIRAKGTNGAFSEFTNIVNVSNGAPYDKDVDIVQMDTPKEFGLHQNYPNPFNPSTEISYSVPEPSFVSLSVFNSVGQEIAQLVKEFKGVGNHSITWNASGLPSGVYFYSFKAGKYSSLKKMILAK